MGGNTKKDKGDGIPTMIPGKTGEDTSVKKKAPVFHGNQTFYLVEWLTTLYGSKYGIDPNNKTQLVRIFYRPQIDDEIRSPDYSVIAAYMSVWNVNLSTRLSKDKYRIGVDLWDVKDSISKRIDLAIELLDSGDVKDTAEIGNKLDILNSVIENIENLISADWTHIVLATAWTEKKGKKTFDRLDLNLDFFRVFYPRKAFPIGKGVAGSQVKWVDRDKLVMRLFPNGKLVRSKKSRPGGKKGHALWNRYELKMSKNSLRKYPNLKITFNHSRVDIWSEEDEKSKKMVSRWPTINEVVSDLEQDLKDHPYGKAAERVRKKAFKWIAKFQQRSMRLLKKKKNKLADENDKAASKLIEAVQNSLTKEQKKLIKDLKGTDPNGKDFAGAVRRALSGAGHIQLTGADEETADETMKIIGEKFEEQAKNLMKEFEDINPNDPKFKDKVKKLIKAGTGLAMFGSEDETVFNKIFEKISDKYSKEIEKMADDDKKWDPNKFMDYNSKKILLGGKYKASKKKWAKLKEKNYREMQRVYEANSQGQKLNRSLKKLIDIHQGVFGGNIPDEWIQKHASIRKYIEGLISKEKIEESLPDKLTPEVLAESTNPEMGKKI